MKNAASPQINRSNQRKQDSNGVAIGSYTNKSHQRTHTVFNYIKAAAKKVGGVFTIFLFWSRKAACNRPKTDATKHHGQLSGDSFPRDNSSGSNSGSSSKFKYSNSYRSSTTTGGQVGNFYFSIEEIFKATENFSAVNKLGEGGFGTVYKGKLKNGSFVAVKRAKKDLYDKRFSEFKNEVHTLSKIEHLNLVRLFGYLEHGEERIIVVEYVANGTLREHLDGIRGNGLEISERLDIATDVAHAVTYLHMYTDLPIIHRDIKSSNILITEKLRAKVADFGFARMAVEDSGATHISTQVKGTAGYLDPEYLRTYQLTEKSDVYSFGVLLIELVTGRLPLEPKRPPKERITARWAMQRLKEGDTVLAMDLRLRRSPASIEAVEKVLKLARQCLAPSRQSRPSMKKCAEVLWAIRKDFKDRSVSIASTSHQSANVVERDARKGRYKQFGIEDTESYTFRSA
ncbi:calmodulin-binding receptor-like cytoplasmic kinase 1 isoform X2 [Cornus florida]|uniref:calmodulin-binding receptor-like cytoplasmic kinase 1 isoform X2 n=1 Tax=Cornus florida TaxID=4283 RepID=UPI00289DFE26|nr:calmodulin-binding receptor-like cytoplasmic kinase 1 isoform X2 [Cornus florida]